MDRVKYDGKAKREKYPSFKPEKPVLGSQQPANRLVWKLFQFVWKLLFQGSLVWKKLFQGTISVLIYVVSNIYNQSSILVETIQDRWDCFLQDYKGIEASDYIDRNDFIEHVRYESIPIYE